MLDDNNLKKVILREFHTKTIFRSPRLPEDNDNSEETLLLAESKEGCSRVRG